MAFTAERNLIPIFDNFEILPELLDVGLVTLHLCKFYLLPAVYLWLQLGRIQDFSRGGGQNSKHFWPPSGNAMGARARFFFNSKINF